MADKKAVYCARCGLHSDRGCIALCRICSGMGKKTEQEPKGNKQRIIK